MARTNDPAALARVPLSDVPAVPIFSRNGQVFEWLKARGVEVKPDHADRPSITLADAYRLQAESVAENEAEQARRQAAAENMSAQIDKAQQRRQELYAKTYLANLPAGIASTMALTEARQAAWVAVRSAEKHLPPEVAQRLGPVSLDGLPGNPGFHMMNITMLPAQGESY